MNGPRQGSRAKSADRLNRLDRYHAGYRLDGTGDLRRDLEPARELHLDLGPFAQHQHERDLAVVGRRAAWTFKPLGHALDRRLVAQEDAQALSELGRRLAEWLGHLLAPPDAVPLPFRRAHQQPGADVRARIQVAEPLDQAAAKL